MSVICVPTSERTRVQAESWGCAFRRSTRPGTRPDRGRGRRIRSRAAVDQGRRRRAVARKDRRGGVQAHGGHHRRQQGSRKLGKFKLPVEADRFGLAATAAISKRSRATWLPRRHRAAQGWRSGFRHRRRPRHLRLRLRAPFPIRTRWPWRSTPFPAWSNTACSSASPAP